MATFDSDGPAWTATERTRRTVALNPPEALQDLLQLVASILSKILDNPSDPKYRSLKQSGRVCQQRLLGRPGGRELLASLGFKSDERADAIAAHAGPRKFPFPAVARLEAQAGRQVPLAAQIILPLRARRHVIQRPVPHVPLAADERHREAAREALERRAERRVAHA